MMKTQSLDTIAAVAHKTTYAGAAGGFWGWLTDNATLGLIGTLIALAGVALNGYFRYKADKRTSAEHALRMQEQHLRIAKLQTQLADQEEDV